MKKIKKFAKPAYVVDITDCVDESDVMDAIIAAKLANNKAITKAQMKHMESRLIENIIEAIIAAMFSNGNTVISTPSGFIFGNAVEVETNTEAVAPTTVKKPNIFKRFWNWVTRKK